MILLLLILTPSAAALEVKVTQSSYQAEENHHITLEWTFPAEDTTRNIFVLCDLMASRKTSVLYLVYAGVEISESVDEGFSGRVQSDTDALREGRIRLHLSRLRTEDSGLYVCEVRTASGSGFDSCQLNITEAAAQPQIQKPPRPQPDTGQTRHHYGLIAAAAAAEVVLVLLIHFTTRNKRSHFVWQSNNLSVRSILNHKSLLLKVSDRSDLQTVLL
ncbi:uncharacterized protein LOC114431533 [Parambassis ranga]|uniref:Uncharacterized protein LOC114431533 n=1 Tax=Parambassis ranga TaxID=210632 RepID=A0A6P7HWG0_9TELE|nr:uncharacterized protein LOC114431533 [Parambassis ranga]